MQSSKLLLLGVISQGPHPYAGEAIPPSMELETYADCNITVEAFDAETDAPMDRVDPGTTPTIKLTFTNTGDFPFTVVMPQEVVGLTFPYGWSDPFPIVPPGGSVSTQVETVVTAVYPDTILFEFIECPEPLELLVQGEV